MRVGQLCLCLCVFAASAGAQPRLGKLSPAEIDAFLAELQKGKLSLVERVNRVSARFLGTRYVRDPLGEGSKAGEDPDPLVDLARVDCVTFVEQVLALAQRPTLAEGVTLLQRYRYARGR